MQTNGLSANERMAAEMAAVNVVTSVDLVKNANNSTELNDYQNKLNDAKDRVQSVKDTLIALKTHEVTPSLVQILDNQLIQSGAEIPVVDGLNEVTGAESLGLTMKPSEFLFTRRVGAENFLEGFFKATREVILQLKNNTKEAYILFTQSQDSLAAMVDLLQNTVSTTPSYSGDTQSILLGSRLFRTFQINGKVSGDWVNELGKLSRSISGLSKSYYLTKQNSLNETIGYFGGFASLNQVEAEERFAAMPLSISSKPFKECSYNSPDDAAAGVVAKRSVELMGGAYFLDKRSTSGKDDWLARYLAIDGTVFKDDRSTEYPKLDLQVKTLTTGEIKAVVTMLREVIGDWRKIFEGADKYALAEAEYLDVNKSIYEAGFDDALKDRVLTAYSSIVRKNQQELLNIRSSVNTYLVLIIAALVEFCHTSIKVNTP